MGTNNLNKMKTIIAIIKMWFDYQKEYKNRKSNNHNSESEDFDYIKYGLSSDTVNTKE